MLPDTWITYWGNTVTNAIEKHVRKGAILSVHQCTNSIWYIRCEEEENIEDQGKIEVLEQIILI